MIVRKIHIDNFGCFHDFDMELSAGLNRLSRPNEFGKTTLLEFIRRILWGFPDKRRKLNPYPALKGSGFYGGFLDVTLRDGRELRLERRGERGRLRIISPEGTVEECDDVGALAGVSENFYRNVCAVSIDELTAFAALDDDEVRNRLYGNALSFGEISLSELAGRLERGAEVIFKRRGTNNMLKKLADEFAASEGRLAAAAESLPAYEKAVLTAERLEKDSDELKKELEMVQREITRCETIMTVARRRRELEEEERKFAERKVPEPLPEPLPPFEEKAPLPPPEPAYPERLSPPEEPDAGPLEGKCDYRRAVPVTETFPDETRKRFAAFSEFSRSRFPWKAVSGAASCFAAAALFSLAAVVHPLLAAPGMLFLIAGAYFFLLHRREAEAAARKMAEFEKFREDLFFRFHLNPALEDEEIPELLEALAAFQERSRLRQAAVKQTELREGEIARLRREYDLRRKMYDEACAAYGRRREEYDRQRLSFEELCRSRSAALAAWEAEKLALAKRRRELPDAPAGEEEIDSGRLELLRERAAELRQRIETNARQSGAERREAALLLKGTDCSVELNVREQLRGRMGAAAERYLVLTAARKILEKAVERCERERQPELLKNASEWFAAFSLNSYTRVYKQLSTGALRVGNPETGEERNVSELSRGTREQLFLALRLALILSLEQGAEPLPVVLDDILVDFDPLRRQAVCRGLARFALSRQVLMFDCGADQAEPIRG